MKVARLTAPFTVEFSQEPKPVINDDQVLLKIKCFGVCGSDMQMYHGKHKYMTFPVIPAHEIGAVIEEVGRNVTGFKVGDKVTMEPQVFCGECYPCQMGRFNVCEHLKVMGVHMDGAAREYFAVEPKYLHRVPQDMKDELVALVEPMAVGVGSVRRSGCYKGANICVVGAGTIGNLTAQAARAMGAAKVMITDINQAKLDYAAQCGIDCCVNTKDVSLKDAITEKFGVRKADIIIDCAGTAFTWKSILEAARPESVIVITANFKAPVDFEIPLIQRREIALLGHMMYVREDFADAIRFLSDGTVDASKFISQRFPFDNYPDAFRFADEHPDDVMKMLIEF